VSEWEQIGERLRDRAAYSQGVKDTEERIIKLLEEMPWQVYSAVAIDGNPIESVVTPKVLIREDAIAIIKGDNR